MVDLKSSLEKIEAELQDLKRRAGEEKRAAGKRERRLDDQLKIVQMAKASAVRLDSGAESVGSAGAAHRTSPTRITDPDDESFGFVWPALDPKSGDPIYDVRVVKGHKTYRDRALALARVYGRQLKEGAVAVAVYQTGDTGAGKASSARGSLSSLVRHSADWTRSRGWLYYSGELVCDEEMVRVVLGASCPETEVDEIPQAGIGDAN